MTYKEFIDNIISTRGRHGCGDEYHEKHHIKPRCLGGEDKEENYIDLFAREHYEAHKLLALENPHNSKLQCAWWCMSSMKEGRCSAEEYEASRIAMAEALREANTGKKFSKITKKRMSESAKGRTFSAETLKKFSEAKTGKKHSKEHIQHNADSIRKPVKCLETKIIYKDVTEASELTGSSKYGIGACCRKQQKTCNGFHWSYVKKRKRR